MTAIEKIVRKWTNKPTIKDQELIFSDKQMVKELEKCVKQKVEKAKRKAFSKGYEEGLLCE